MPRFDPAEFGHLMARLTPHELRQAEGLVAEAQAGFVLDALEQAVHDRRPTKAMGLV